MANKVPREAPTISSTTGMRIFMTPTLPGSEGNLDPLLLPVTTEQLVVNDAVATNTTDIAGKAPTVHTHPASDITQSGATNDQILTWNGSAWVPGDPAAGGVTTYIALTDAASVDLPTVNTPLGDALALKAAATHTHPTSDLEQGGAVNGQVIAWNGSAWAPTTSPSGVTTYAELTDKASVDLPAINTPLGTALGLKAASVHTHPAGDITQSGATNDQVLAWNGSAWVPTTSESGVTTYVALTDAASVDLPTVNTPLGTALGLKASDSDLTDHIDAQDTVNSDQAITNGLKAPLDAPAFTGIVTGVDISISGEVASASVVATGDVSGATMTVDSRPVAPYEEITQADYDLLAPPVVGVFYIITDA